MRVHTNYHRVQDLIRADIVEGRFSPNVRLKMVELAVRYGVSPIPIREALQRLEGEGLVSILPNCGARVRLLDERFLRNIIDIGQLLEPYLMRGFMLTARDEDVLQLRAIERRMEAAAEIGDFEVFHHENGLFHSCIHSSHYNDEALRIVDQHRALRRVLSSKYKVNKARMKQSCIEHRKVLGAVLAGDADAAIQAMAEHVRQSDSYLLALVRSDREAIGVKAPAGCDEIKAAIPSGGRPDHQRRSAKSDAAKQISGRPGKRADAANSRANTNQSSIGSAK